MTTTATQNSVEIKVVPALWRRGVAKNGNLATQKVPNEFHVIVNGKNMGIYGLLRQAKLLAADFGKYKLVKE